MKWKRHEQLLPAALGPGNTNMLHNQFPFFNLADKFSSENWLGWSCCSFFSSGLPAEESMLESWHKNYLSFQYYGIRAKSLYHTMHLFSQSQVQVCDSALEQLLEVWVQSRPEPQILCAYPYTSGGTQMKFQPHGRGTCMVDGWSPHLSLSTGFKLSCKVKHCQQAKLSCAFLPAFACHLICSGQSSKGQKVGRVRLLCIDKGKISDLPW